MSDGDDIVTRPGKSDLVTFEIVNKPEPKIRIEQVGPDPDIRWRYDWSERGYPTPEMFERVGHAEVLVVGMMPDTDGDLRQALDAAHDAILEVERVMCEMRGLDEEQAGEVVMGNLDGLPEVEKRDATGDRR